MVPLGSAHSGAVVFNNADKPSRTRPPRDRIGHVCFLGLPVPPLSRMHQVPGRRSAGFRAAGVRLVSGTLSWRGGARGRHALPRRKSVVLAPPVARDTKKKKWRLFSCQVWRLFGCHTQMDFNIVRSALPPRTVALVGRTPWQPTPMLRCPMGSVCRTGHNCPLPMLRRGIYI